MTDPGRRSGADAQLTAVLDAARRRLVLRTLLRAMAVGLLAGAVATIALVGLDALIGFSDSLRRTLRWLPIVLALAPMLLVVRLRGRATDERLALLVDEQAGGDNVVSTLRAPNASGPVADAFRRRARRALDSVDVPGAIPLDAGRLWAGGVAACVLAVVILSLGLPDGAMSGRWLDPAAEGVTGVDDDAAVLLEGESVPTMGDLSFTVRAPAYAGLPDVPGVWGDALAALPGSVVEIRGDGGARPPLLGASVIGGSTLTPQPTGSGWTVDWPVRADERGLVLTVAAAGDTVEQRVLPLRQLRDRPPAVELVAPSDDVVLATPTGTIPIRAEAVDDFGVADVALHWVRSRGSGESFDFDEGTWTWDDYESTARGGTGSLGLALEELGLEPGDVIHVRAVATDGNDVTGPGMGVSATRQIRISREDDLSDVTTIIGFPIEREREPLLSQRMIILLTEELIDSAASMNDQERLEASADIADEQQRLRARIGEQIFSRATGAMQDPESHLDFEEGEAEVFLDELDAAVQQGPVIDPETGIASIANVEIIAHDHDSDPIVAINRSLLTVYNFMWDAERALRAAALQPSLVPQHHALDELQALRDSERVFARGRVTVAPIDVQEVRGTGEVDDAAPARRAASSPTAGVDQRVAADIDRLLADADALRGRAASVEIAGLALDLLRTSDDPTASEHVARAARLAEGDDTGATAEALRAALRLLRASSTRAVQTATRPPTSLSGAAYRGTTDASDPTPAAAERGSAPRPFVFATVRYQSGDWDSAPLVPTNLIHSLAQYTDLPVEPEGVVVDLSSPAVFDYPFLYITGHLPVFFGDAEARNLVDFVNRGGFVFIDDHNHDIDGAFHRSVTTELQRLFGADRFTPVPNDHELYSSFFLFDEGPPITGHELSGWGDGLIHRELFQVEANGRIGVLYSNKDYSSEWSYHADNKRFLAVDNTRFGVNILVYALTR